MTIEDIFDNIDNYSNNIAGLVDELIACGINNYDEFLKVKNNTYAEISRDFLIQVKEEFNNRKKNTEESKTLNNIHTPANPIPQPESTSSDSIESQIKEIEKNIYRILNTRRLTPKLESIYNYLESGLKDNSVSKDAVLHKLKEDNNFLNGDIIKKLISKDLLTAKDILKAGVDEDILEYLIERENEEFNYQNTVPIERITMEPCTEVYFWGLPSSGKSCAIGGLLSTANSASISSSMLMDSSCQGYGYMNYLMNIFKLTGNRRIGKLPASNAVETRTTYEMGFTLEKDSKLYPITFIDLAGELVKAMFLRSTYQLTNQQYSQVLDTFTNILIGNNRTKNRKIHFFVIEYGAENELYDGLSQDSYLQAAATYINTIGVFKRETDAIYILITKADRVKKEGKELEGILKDYIATHYRNFYNVLCTISRDNEICKSSDYVKIFPFSLGKVCFKDFCKFDSSMSENVLREILTSCYGYKKSKIERLREKLRR